MGGTYMVYKFSKENGKSVKRFLSATGKWIKTTPGAAVMDRDDAIRLAAEHKGNIHHYIFRNY